MEFKPLSNPVVITDGGSQSKQPLWQNLTNPFRKLPSNFKKIGAVVLTALLISALALGVYLSKKPTQFTPRADNPTVTLSLKPETLNVAVNQEFQVDVFIDPGQTGFGLTGAQVKINYDGQMLELKNVALTDFMPTPLQSPKNTQGSTEFTVASIVPKSESGVIATLTFKALSSASSTQVTFDNGQVLITALDHPGYVTATLTPSVITFGQSSSSPSPTPNASPETSFTLKGPEIPGPVPPVAQFKVQVLTRSDIENANLWNATISFPKDLIEAVSIDKTGSFISSWSSESLDNTTGQIQLVGGVPNPGYKTDSSNALMATLIFKAKSPGTANITFDPQSGIYSNLSNANILKVKRDISVIISSEVLQSPPPSQSPSPSPSPSPSVSPSPSPSGITGKGDGDNDGKVDLRDLSILFSKWSPAKDITSHFKLDFNNDLRINTIDFSEMNRLLLSLGIIRQ